MVHSKALPIAVARFEPGQAIDLLVWGPAVAFDFNGDGKTDLLAGETVLLNQGVSSVATGTTASATSLSASATNIAPGAALTLTATVSGAAGAATPSGAVTFYDGDTQLGTSTLASGVATYATSSLAVGTHSITASYSGDTTYMPSNSSAVTITVASLPATITTPITTAAVAWLADPAHPRFSRLCGWVTRLRSG